MVIAFHEVLSDPKFQFELVKWSVVGAAFFFLFIALFMSALKPRNRTDVSWTCMMWSLTAVCGRYTVELIPGYMPPEWLRPIPWICLDISLFFVTLFMVIDNRDRARDAFGRFFRRFERIEERIMRWLT